MTKKRWYRHVPKRKDANVLTGSWCYDFKSTSDKNAMNYARSKFYRGAKIYKENKTKWTFVGIV